MSLADVKIEALPWPIAEILDFRAEGSPFLMLGSAQSPYSLLALAWDEIEPHTVLDQPLPPVRMASDLPWILGTVGLISYDAYHPNGAAPQARQRFFRIKRSLVIDRQRQRLFHCEEARAHAARWQTPAPWLATAPVSADLGAEPQWISSWTDEQYVQAVARVLEDIRAGRYYQLNLLRYWSTQEAISRGRWLRRLQRWAGPYGALLDFDDFALVSFSPEQFFTVRPQGDSLMIQTSPIKGTRPVVSDPAQDAAYQRDLASHPKDRAELNMIVDLMRNDLFRICQPQSVGVLDPGSVQSFSNVHHLVAKIEGRLKPRMTLGEMLKALCPGGSITGAPKREVMQAIGELEQRQRSYFMGNLLYFDAYTGRCDSSILIRTAQRLRAGPWEFAAGSGLVIHSDPEDEMAEVAAKARVVLEVLGKA